MTGDTRKMDTMDGYLSLIPKEEEDIAVVVTTLREWNCCPRCVLRLLGDKDQFSYKKSNKELKDWLSNYEKPGPEKTDYGKPHNTGKVAGDEVMDQGDQGAVSEIQSEISAVQNNVSSVEASTPGGDIRDVCTGDVVCVSCVGVLQKGYCSAEYCQTLYDVIQKEDYEYDTYYISLSIPVPLMVREYAIFSKLKELLPSIYDESARDDITQIKEAWKWANGSAMSSLLKVNFDQRSLFEVKVDFSHDELEKECSFLLDLFPEVFRKRKIIKQGCEVFTRVNVPKALSDMGEEVFRKNYQCPPRPTLKPCQVEQITCTHEQVYVAGRYNKYSRFLSQTPWLVEGERRTQSSVEEMICCHLKATFLAKDYKLSASGREDVDVLMLGRGRPFVVEMINPRRIHFQQSDMTELQAKINSAHDEIRVRDLQVVSKQSTSHLKKGEEKKVKIYSAQCWISKPVTQDTLDSALDSTKDLVIKQKTPVRVLHRRSLAVRDRTIHTMSAKLKDDQHFNLCLSTQAGTYIKEFVHGDFGRTSPNLGHILGGECDILELNVDAVELDWPKQLEDFDLDD